MNACAEAVIFENSETCAFCKRNTVDEFHLGKIYKLKNTVVHYFCLLFATNLQQNGADQEGILGFLISDIKKELKNRAKTLCKYCHLPGATSICGKKKCSIKFHFPCGIENNSFHLFFNSFKSYCNTHRHKKHPRFPTSHNLLETCIICQSSVTPTPLVSTVWASCCKTILYHKSCIQELALSAGYFFKCPNCNNYDKFRQEMLYSGIYIPDHDASWETDPNYFGDLTERHNTCNAFQCLCPKGSSFSRQSGPWKLFLCNTCGSQGIHKECGALPTKRKLEWTCDLCVTVMDLKQIRKSPLTGINPVVWKNNSPKTSKKQSSSNSTSLGIKNCQKQTTSPLIARESKSYEPVRKKRKEMKNCNSTDASRREHLVTYNFDGIRVKIPSDYEKKLKEFEDFLNTSFKKRVFNCH